MEVLGPGGGAEQQRGLTAELHGRLQSEQSQVLIVGRAVVVFVQNDPLHFVRRRESVQRHHAHIHLPVTCNETGFVVTGIKQQKR